MRIHSEVPPPPLTYQLSIEYVKIYQSNLLTYCPSCHRQLGQQQIISISGGLEPVSVRCPIIVQWRLPLPQQYVSMSSLDAFILCVPLVSTLLLLLGWSLDLCIIYGLSISKVYVQLRSLYSLAGIDREEKKLQSSNSVRIH